MIRVLIKASSAIAKAGLESLLTGHPSLQLVADSSGRTRGTAAGAESPPDVLVVEAETLASHAAREALEWALAGGQAVLLVRNPALEPIAEALHAGVKAVLPSGLAAPEIATAIEALLPPPRPASRVTAETLVEALTPREIEVLRLVAGGLGNKEIASRLGISEHTAKFHVASILGKLGAQSRTEAVTLGIRHGLILI